MTGSPRTVGDLLAETLKLYRANLGAVVALAGGVVLVVDLILGLGLGELGSAYRTSSRAAESAITIGASALVTTPLITAMIARTVLDLHDGRPVSAGRAATVGLDVFAPLLAAVLMYVAAVLAGALAFVIPGVYLAVLWYFVAQAVVIDGRRGPAALARSGELVRGNWWRALGTGVLFNAIVGILGSVVALGVDALARAANAEAVVVAGNIVFETFALSFVAIGATLFYLDLRRRAGG
jgi:hypothetical protein